MEKSKLKTETIESHHAHSVIRHSLFKLTCKRSMYTNSIEYQHTENILLCVCLKFEIII